MAANQKHGWGGVIIVSVILIGAGVGVYFVMKNQKPSIPQQNANNTSNATCTQTPEIVNNYYNTTAPTTGTGTPPQPAAATCTKSSSSTSWWDYFI